MTLKDTFLGSRGFFRSKMEFQNHSTEFDPYIREANILVDAVINNALTINKEYLIGGGSNNKEEEGCINAELKIIDPEEKPEEETVHMDPTGAIPNIKWLTGKEFTIEAGKNKIDEFLKVVVKCHTTTYLE